MAQYDGHDGQWLDSMYNNRALVPDHAAYFARWDDLSKRARGEGGCELDIAYGPSPGEKLDVFRPRKAKAPVFVFIHGGYWRALHKEDHSFVAPPLVEAGACVVVPDYDLCPAVTIPEITLQMVRALAWTWKNIERFGGDRSRITVAGHSAGGHLAAMMLACRWKAVGSGLPQDLVKTALSISGLFDLEPIMHTPFLKESLRLTPKDALRASPALMPAPSRGHLFTVAGGAESAEFLRHNTLIRERWGDAAVPLCEVMPGRNHFSVLDGLADPSHRLHAIARQAME